LNELIEVDNKVQKHLINILISSQNSNFEDNLIFLTEKQHNKRLSITSDKTKFLTEEVCLMLLM
jgi:hypothetical protein